MTTQLAQQVRTNLAILAARKAGALVLEHFQSKSLIVDTKHDQSVVTVADRNAEKLLRSMIETDFPEDTIVGEEFGEKKGTSGWTWYLDPIDGTQAFVRGVPLFGTLIGVEHQSSCEIGVIGLPALGEMVYASRGKGCFWQKGSAHFERAHVSQVHLMDQAMFCTTWMQSFRATSTIPLFTELCAKTGVFRGWGDCYGYALVATGRAEIMVDPQLHVWDAAPMVVILEEAGGHYVGFNGKPTIHSGNGIATNAHLYDPVMAIVNRCTSDT